MLALLHCREEEALYTDASFSFVKCHIQRDLFEVTSSYNRFQQFTICSANEARVKVNRLLWGRTNQTSSFICKLETHEAT